MEELMTTMMKNCLMEHVTYCMELAQVTYELPFSASLIVSKVDFRV